MKKFLSLLLVLVMLLPVLAIGASASAPGWVHDDYGWYYQDPWYGCPNNGVYYVDGLPYYFDQDCYLCFGWNYNGFDWFHSDDNGVVQTGWQYIDGNWYYFDCRMLTNAWVDGCYLGYDGTWMPEIVRGWTHDDNGWYYITGDGSWCVGLSQIGDEYYYFDGNGYLCFGWTYADGQWYYGTDSGALLTGWQQIGDTWYFFYPEMATDDWIDGWYVNSNGAWIY